MIASKAWAGASLIAMVVSAATSAGLVGASIAGCLAFLLFLVAAHEPTRRRFLSIVGSRIRNVRSDRTAGRHA